MDATPKTFEAEPDLDECLVGIGWVARRLDVTERYVRRLIADGRITYIKLGAAVRFDRRDVKQYIDEGRCPAAGRGGSARASACPTCSADRQVSNRQPRRTERDDDTAVEVLDNRRQVGEKEAPVVVRRQFRNPAQKDDGRQGRTPQRQEHGEVGVGGDDDVAIGNGPVEDDRVRSGQQIQFPYVNNVVPGVGEQPDDTGGQVGVEQKPHAKRATGASRSFTTAAANSSAARTSARSK